MKKLNEVTANELLHELRTKNGYNEIDDCVQYNFYSHRKSESRLICRCYTIDSIGGWLIEKTVCAYTFTEDVSKAFNDRMITVDVVINFN